MDVSPSQPFRSLSATVTSQSPSSTLRLAQSFQGSTGHGSDHDSTGPGLQSNEWTGKYSFGGLSLHHVGQQPNPYEQAFSIIGRTLAPFDDDNLIPAYGFGDGESHPITELSQPHQFPADQTSLPYHDSYGEVMSAEVSRKGPSVRSNGYKRVIMWLEHVHKCRFSRKSTKSARDVTMQMTNKAPGSFSWSVSTLKTC